MKNIRTTGGEGFFRSQVVGCFGNQYSDYPPGNSDTLLLRAEPILAPVTISMKAGKYSSLYLINQYAPVLHKIPKFQL